MLIDAHAHVHDPAFEGDREEVLERARASGVERVVCVGATDGMDGARAALALVEKNGDIDATVGVHPHDVARMTEEDWSELRRLCDHPKVVAVGETGLDYYYDHSPREVQRRCFRRFVALAREVRKPVVVHIRDAHEDAAAILAEEGAREVGGQIHCFTGGPEDAARYLAMDLHISFSGIVTFRKAEAIQAAAREVPLHRLLVETDCPYLAPVPVRGKRNEPAFVRHVAVFLAGLRGTSLEELGAATTANARSLFGLGT
jgi:TatD DNase family protein